MIPNTISATACPLNYANSLSSEAANDIYDYYPEK